MKEPARSLSILLGILLFGSIVWGQSSIVIQKKYDFSSVQNIFPQDTTLSLYQVNMPLVYDSNKLALFCKFEEKVAQSSNVNMRFRLGSLDYVNYLERKPNWQLSKSNRE